MEEVTDRRPPEVDAYQIRKRANFLDRRIEIYEGRLEEIKSSEGLNVVPSELLEEN